MVIASSGNGAAATAALAAKTGMEALIYVPESTPDEKVMHTMVCGGTVVRVPGPFSNSYDEALRDGAENGVCNLATTFLNPFTIDGDKVVAYEIYLQAGVPDAIYVPIGTGPLLVGILRGFEELMALGLIDRIPKMVGVQATGCSPMAQAFKKGIREVTGEPNPVTIAGGICDGLTGHEQDGTFTLDAIFRSNGICTAVTDEEIQAAQNELARTEGLFVEPSSAAGIAAIKKTAVQLVGEGGTVVTLLTGHGLKDMKNVVIMKGE